MEQWSIGVVVIGRPGVPDPVDDGTPEIAREGGPGFGRVRLSRELDALIELLERTGGDLARNGRFMGSIFALGRMYWDREPSSDRKRGKAPQSKRWREAERT